MVAIFPPHGAETPDVTIRLKIAGSVLSLEMRGCHSRHRFLTILGFQLRRKKALRFFPWRFYSENVLSGLEGSDTGFNPTRRALDRADREFELLGPNATFQGSALKLEDAPKLKLPEVMSHFVHTDTVYYWLPLEVYPQVNHGDILGNTGALDGYSRGPKGERDFRRLSVWVNIIEEECKPAGHFPCTLLPLRDIIKLVPPFLQSSCLAWPGGQYSAHI